jgi:hypothetical protein
MLDWMLSSNLEIKFYLNKGKRFKWLIKIQQEIFINLGWNQSDYKCMFEVLKH